MCGISIDTLLSQELFNFVRSPVFWLLQESGKFAKPFRTLKNLRCDFESFGDVTYFAAGHWPIFVAR